VFAQDGKGADSVLVAKEYILLVIAPLRHMVRNAWKNEAGSARCERARRPGEKLLHSQVGYVHVGTEAHVVRQIPAVVVRVCVEDDLVAVPEPAVAIRCLERGNLEIAAIKPEPVGAATGEPPYVIAP